MNALSHVLSVKVLIYNLDNIAIMAEMCDNTDLPFMEILLFWQLSFRCWEKQHALFHTKEANNISYFSTIVHRKCECCHGDSSVFKNIYSWKYLSLVLSLWQVSQHACVHTHTHFFPLLKKWIMAEDYEYGKRTNSLTVEPVAQPASAGSTLEESGPWNHTLKTFSLVRHKPNSTHHPYTHTSLVKLCCAANTHFYNFFWVKTHSWKIIVRFLW